MKSNGGIFFMIAGIILLGSFFLVPVHVQGQEQAQKPEAEPAGPSLATVDELLSEKTIENCEKAVKQCELLLKNAPDNPEILYRLANSYIGIMDIKTSALIEEKDEFKPMLKKLGEIANGHAEKAYKLKPKNKNVVAANLVSYGYYSASFGIVKAIFKGAAGHYKDLCNQLIKIDDKHLGALGYRLLGKLYHVAPWPVGSKKKALQFFQKAVQTDNSVLYSHYYIGVIQFEKRNYDLAEKEFKFIGDNPPHACEKHYSDAYKEKARRYLMSLDRVKKKK
jgi:tetratricopeptide (TPR) repeat protein